MDIIYLAPAIQFADILLLTIKYTSPPSFSRIGPKLPKFNIWDGFGWVAGGWGGLNMGQTLFLFSCIPPKVTSMHNFIDIG